MENNNRYNNPEEFIRNSKLIYIYIKKKKRFKSERHNVFAEEINNIA